MDNVKEVRGFFRFVMSREWGSPIREPSAWRSVNSGL